MGLNEINIIRYLYIFCDFDKSYKIVNCTTCSIIIVFDSIIDVINNDYLFLKVTLINNRMTCNLSNHEVYIVWIFFSSFHLVSVRKIKMFLSLRFDKKSLIGINVAFMIVAFMLVGTCSYVKYVYLIKNLPIVGGIAACGVFLMLVAIFGIVAILRQSQSLMFYYMVFLEIIFFL